MKKINALALSSLTAALLIGCGGGSSGGGNSSSSTAETITPTTPVITTQTLSFIDDKVSGIKYVNGTASGFTDANGNFPYTSGTVEFYLGDIKLGSLSSIPTDKNVFIQDILGIDRTDTSNAKVLKIASLLQSLDSNTSTDEIEIKEEDFNKFKNQSITSIDENSDIQTLLTNLNFTKVSDENTKRHLDNSLKYYGVVSDTTAPTLLSSSILNGTTNVSKDANIVLSFSDDIRKNLIKKENISLVDASNSVVDFTLSHNFNVITITPLSLSYATTYNLTLKSTIEDYGKNSLGTTDTTISFTTQNETTKIEGKVIDGYIVGAKVCIDINLNQSCDSGEPTATTKAGGSFVLETTNENKQYPIIAEAGVDAFDESTNAHLEKPLKLMAPANSTNTIVSPFTTLVQNKIYSGVPKSEAEVSVGLLLGINKDLVYANYIASNDENSYKKAVNLAGALQNNSNNADSVWTMLEQSPTEETKTTSQIINYNANIICNKNFHAQSNYHYDQKLVLTAAKLSTIVYSIKNINSTLANEQSLRSSLNYYGFNNYDALMFNDTSTNTQAFILETPTKIFISFKGTGFDDSETDDLIRDADTDKTDFVVNGKTIKEGWGYVEVHKGFYEAANKFFNDTKDSVIMKDGKSLIENLKSNKKDVIVTGHSLGGGIGVLYGAMLRESGVAKNKLEVVTFGAPSAGDTEFQERYEPYYYDKNDFGKGMNSIRVRSQNDIIPYLAYLGIDKKLLIVSGTNLATLTAYLSASSTFSVINHQYKHVGFMMAFDDVGNQLDANSDSTIDLSTAVKKGGDYVLEQHSKTGYISKVENHRLLTISPECTDKNGNVVGNYGSIFVMDEIPDTTPPVFTSSGFFAVPENQTSAFTTVATDASAITYSISGTDASSFNIDSSTGVVTFKTNPDFETKNSYYLEVKATDVQNNSSTQNVTINITDVAETVTFQSGDTWKGKVYNIITSPITGKRWLDRNLGASQACTSSTDSACYGDYYQWGRLADGHEKSNSTTTTTQASTITSVGNQFITGNSDWTTADTDGSQRSALWSKTDGTGVCPVGFRVPTFTELKTETLDNGVTNSATAFSNFLKFPVAGFRHSLDGSMHVRGSWGFVWTSSVDGSYSVYEVFGSGTAGWYGYNRAYGPSVRCVEN